MEIVLLVVFLWVKLSEIWDVFGGLVWNKFEEVVLEVGEGDLIDEGVGEMGGVVIMI